MIKHPFLFQNRAAMKAEISLLIICFAVTMATTNAIGVNWGRQMSHPIDLTIMTRMIVDNEFHKVKLFDSDPKIVNALVGSGIEVMLAIPNDELERMGNDYGSAEDWVNENVLAYVQNGRILMQYVAVGNQPFLEKYNGSFVQNTLPAMKNIQQALNEAGVGSQIKAITPLSSDACGFPIDNPVPSAGDFRPDIHSVMVDLVKFLHENNAPFVVNIHPFLSLLQDGNMTVDFAFFNGGGSTLTDKDLEYDNVFDASYDTLVWSLKKAGVGDMKIIVGEVGWPTDGDLNATVPQSKRFYDGFLKKLAAKKGTPLRPGVDMEVYLFSLIDEDKRSIAATITETHNYETHWGLFRYDGQPKFPMDLSGNNNSNKNLIAAKGVKYLPKQWCVFNMDTKYDTSKTPYEAGYACQNIDCTAISPGGSCIKLPTDNYTSYSFNLFYQMNDQDVRACDFAGLAKVVTADPSVPYCPFPIQIVSGGGRAGVRVGALMVVLGAVMVLL